MLICRLDKKFRFVDWTKNFNLSIGQKISICRLDKKFQFVDWTNQKNFQLKKNYRLFNRLIKTEL